ncbi:MAG: hypothetical protein FD123_3453 [Bacteroidetes bacterium]|nr:MAG: hypothetical protein FD123_3453 [Bacteroidota bacterium]
MKTHSDELFGLVKAMTAKEKFFFKAFGCNNNSKAERGYLLLFDALNELKQYDEPALRAKLEKQGFSHNINKAKNYLGKAILKSLETYHSGGSVHAEIHHLISQAEILYKKRLVKMAHKILAKAEKMALDAEKQEYLLLIHSLKSNIALHTANLPALNDILEKGIQQKKNYFRLLMNNDAYINLAIAVTAYGQSPELKTGNKTNLERISRLLNHTLLHDSASAQTVVSRYHFYNLNYLRFFHENKWDDRALQVLREGVTYLEARRNVLNDSPEMYLKALGLLLNALAITQNERETGVVYNKARKYYRGLPNKYISQHIQQEFFRITTSFIGIQINFLRPEKAVQTFHELSRYTSPAIINNPLNFVLFINMTESYLMTEQYRKALFFANKILNYKGKYRVDLQAFVKIYELLIQYKLKKDELLPYLAKSTERWLKKNDYQPRFFDKALIDFFKFRLPKINSAAEKRETMQNLLAQLKAATNTEYSILKNTFDLAAWLESEIQQKPMLEIMRKTL